MNSNNNNMTTSPMDFDDEIKDLSADFRQDCSFSNDDYREERELQDIMRCNSPENNNIFRELPDTDYTPIEYSNDTILLSPAWSQDSMMNIMEEDDLLKLTSSNSITVPSQMMYLNAGAAPTSSVNRISDFDMSSGTIQRLNF